jgi:hypothetical protein
MKNHISDLYLMCQNDVYFSSSIKITFLFLYFFHNLFFLKVVKLYYKTFLKFVTGNKKTHFFFFSFLYLYFSLHFAFLTLALYVFTCIYMYTYMVYSIAWFYVICFFSFIFFFTTFFLSVLFYFRFVLLFFYLTRKV